MLGKTGKNGDHQNPRFPPDFWNKYITVTYQRLRMLYLPLHLQVLKKERRSTNVMEAFHRSLLDIIEVAQPNFMLFIKDLWQIASVMDRDAALTAAAVPNVRRVGDFEMQENRRIFKIVEQYDAYPSIIDYLKALSLKPKSLMTKKYN